MIPLQIVKISNVPFKMYLAYKAKIYDIKQFIISFVMQLINASSLEGYLEKQSPGVIKIYQKRYFAIRNNGQFILWFGKKPNSIDVQPKGVIITIKIDAVKADDFDNRIFTITYHNRVFILKAENKDLRDRWVNAITTIIEHLKRTLKNRFSEINKQPTDWKFQNASEEVIKSIRLENEKLLLKEDEGLLQKSAKQLVSIIGFNASSDIEKCITFGFLNRKAFVGSDQKWYFLFSEFNLSDDRDDAFNDKIRPFFDSINAANTQKEPKKRKKDSSSDSSQDEQKAKKEINSVLQVNYLYQYDLKTNMMTQQFNLIDILEFSKDISQTPFLLKIVYAIYDESNPDVDEITKQILLQSEYMSEIEKWYKAFQIIFSKYSIPKIREALLEKRFQKFQIKLIKLNEETEWRVMGTPNKPEYVLVNQEVLKVSGHTFEIESISKEPVSSRMNIMVKQNPDEEAKEKDANVLSLSFKENKKLELVIENKEMVKVLKKKLKKYMKNRSSEKELRGASIDLDKKDNSQDTYLIDKKIREASMSIKINFYEMMDREVSTMKQAKQPKQETFFDKFLNMFCGPPKQEESLYF